MKTNLPLPEKLSFQTPAAGKVPKVIANGAAFIVDWQMPDARVGANAILPQGREMLQPCRGQRGPGVGR